MPVQNLSHFPEKNLCCIFFKSREWIARKRSSKTRETKETAVINEETRDERLKLLSRALNILLNFSYSYATPRGGAAAASFQCHLLISPDGFYGSADSFCSSLFCSRTDQEDEVWNDLYMFGLKWSWVCGERVVWLISCHIEWLLRREKVRKPGKRRSCQTRLNIVQCLCNFTY